MFKLCLLFSFISFYTGDFAISSKNPEKNLILYKIVDEMTQQSNLEQLITDVLYEKIRSMKCFTLLCDPMYCNIITSKMFKRFKVHVTYFLIRVQESEDLLSPNNETQNALGRVKTEGCSFYIILLANGLQVSRFLQYGDRYRVLNTRANFVFLYDIRLFHKALHYIWNRIVNVVFIREYGGSSQSKTKKGVAIPWFDLSTVPFPTPVRGVFIPKRLDTWRKGHFRLGIDLFRDKTLDLKNQTFRVVTFQHIPATVKTYTAMENNNTSVPNKTSVRYTGLEIEILKTLSDQMNFGTSIYEPNNADVEKWGQKQDGKFSGLIGEMVKFEAEIALGDMHYSPYHLELMDLTIPYNTECLTFITPESSTDNSWMTLILPFKLYMWLAVLLVVFVLGFIFFSLAKFHRFLYDSTHEPSCTIVESTSKSAEILREKLPSPFKNLQFHKRSVEIIEDDEEKPHGLYLFEKMFNSFLYTYSMLLLISLPKVPDGWSLRMIVGWYWLYCTLVVVSYKASMTAILANPAEQITIDNLDELEKSNLACGGWGENIKDFFLTSLDTAGQKIGEKFEHINNTEQAVERVAKGEFAYYENIYYLKAAAIERELKIISKSKKENYRENGENRDLHIMENCIINMPISLGLQKNSPIKPRVDIVIRRVIEGGFVKKWLDDVMQATLTREDHSSENSIALVNLEKLYCGFVALFSGYLISFIGLGIELAYWHFVVKKHPNFDKYSQTIYTPLKLIH